MFHHTSYNTDVSDVLELVDPELNLDELGTHGRPSK